MVYVVVDLEGVSLWGVTLISHVVITHPHIPFHVDLILIIVAIVIIGVSPWLPLYLITQQW